MSTLPFILPNYSDSSPAAPSGRLNVKWQKSAKYPDPDGSQNFVEDVSSNFPNIGGIDARTTTTELISLTSQGKLVTLSNASAIAATLDSTVPAGYFVAVFCSGAGSATLTPSSGTINTFSSFPLTSAHGCWLFFDGTNWEVLKAPPQSGDYSFSQISGTVAASQLPTPTSSTLGGIESLTAVAHKWINQISTAGVPSATQPDVSDVSNAASQANVQGQGYTYAADSGSANAYAVTLSPAPTIAAGSYVCMKAANNNTGASTLAVNGGAATAIKKAGATALASGDIVAGEIYVLVYDGTNWQLVSWPGTSGSFSVTSPTVRGTGIQASSNSSYTVSWPSGTVKGDLAIILVGHGFAANLPSGWTQLDNLAGSNWNGAVFYRYLNAADITAGSVAVTTAGSFDGVLAIITIDLATTVGIRPTFISQRNGSGSASITLATDGAPLTTDLMVYFGSNRAASTDTVSLGTLQRQANDGSNASGCLYTGAPAANGGVSPVFSYSGSGSGNYQVALAVRAYGGF